MAKFSILLKRSVAEYVTLNKDAETEEEAIKLALAEAGAGIGLWGLPNFVQNPELFKETEERMVDARPKPKIEVHSVFKHRQTKSVKPTLTLPKKQA